MKLENVDLYLIK